MSANYNKTTTAPSAQPRRRDAAMCTAATATATATATTTTTTATATTAPLPSRPTVNPSTQPREDE